MTAPPVDRVRQERAVRLVLDEEAIQPEPDGSSFVTLEYDDLVRLCGKAYLAGWEHASEDALDEIRQLTEERDNPRPMGR
jgi:hypothetical protein